MNWEVLCQDPTLAYTANLAIQFDLKLLIGQYRSLLSFFSTSFSKQTKYADTRSSRFHHDD